LSELLTNAIGIVHDGGESPVYNSDVNLLRKLLYHSIVEMFELRDDYTRQETIGILNYGLVDKANIKDKKEKPMKTWMILKRKLPKQQALPSGKQSEPVSKMLIHSPDSQLIDQGIRL